METTKLLFSILQSEICDAPLTMPLTFEEREKLYTLSKSHDLSHIVASVLQKNGMLGNDTVSANFQKQQMLAVYRYERARQTSVEIYRTFEENKIPFLPLKGAVLREYYPLPWMRTSCDIDILVRPEDLKSTISVLVEHLKYQKIKRHTHDVKMLSPNGVFLELHFLLLEDSVSKSCSAILSDIWEHVSPKEGYSYQMQMPDELFYFYHLVHMAKHIKNGGCGIRPFLDLWMLDNAMHGEKEKRDALLKKGGLLVFAEAARALSKVWFSNAPHNDTTRILQKFILGGEAYGTTANKIAIQHIKRGGKLYLLSKLFVPYDVIKYRYPILQKHKWLLPLMQIRRWCRWLIPSAQAHSLRDLAVHKSLSKNQVTEIQTILTQIGL